jgi:D-aspartate ligase
MQASFPVVVLKLFHHTSIGITRSLGRLGVPVYGVHGDPRAPSALSRYCAGNFLWDFDGATADASLDFLASVAERVGGHPILMPTDDISAIFVEDHADRLREHFVFPSQPPGLARSLSSKKEMYAICKRLDIPTPETTFPQSRDEVLRFLETAVFPVVIKGIDARLVQQLTGGGKVIVDSAEGLLAAYERMESPERPNLLLQEYIPGGAESVWMFNGYFGDSSECLLSFTGQKIRQYPTYTGQASLGICVPNPAVEELTKTMMKRLGYRGILDIGWRYDARDGKYKLLDVNPRIGATFRLFVASNGMDVARALYFDLTGQVVPAAAARAGRRWLVENYDLAAAWKYWRDGVLTVPDWLRSFRGVEEAAWFARDDLKPFAMTFWRLLRKAEQLFVTRRKAVPGWWKSPPPADAAPQAGRTRSSALRNASE